MLSRVGLRVLCFEVAGFGVGVAAEKHPVPPSKGHGAFSCVVILGS